MRLATILLVVGVLACGGGGGGGGSFAASGGMSGTGISQGSISAFGSIFVNGVEWELGGATIELDGASGTENDLRLGMIVRVEGDFSSDGVSGTASRVTFDDDIEGPIETDPVLLDPTRKQLSVLATTVIADADDTIFDDGASFDGLALDQVIEVSGFRDPSGAIRATRIGLVGIFPGVNEVERRGTVSNLVPDAMGGGVFDLDGVTVFYDDMTLFEDGDEGMLADGSRVEVEGILALNGTEIDADTIEFEDDGLGDEDLEAVEIEGFVTSYVSDADFVVAGVSVDASMAAFDPAGLMLADGVQVEVEGRFESGVLIAEVVEGEGDDDGDEADVRIEAAVSAVSTDPNTLTLLGVDILVDGDTVLEDDRDLDPNFRFSDIQPGDWLEVEAVSTGPGTARALEVERDLEDDDLRLEGPVTSVAATPAISVLDQAIALDGATRYFDAVGMEVAEGEFFGPAGVQEDDVVRVVDEDAADLEALGVADRLEIID